MSTPPKTPREEVTRAIARIVQRRADVDDRNRDLLPDAPDAEPRDVLTYLMRYSGNNIPTRVKHADAKDALVLCNHLWWEQRRLEWHFLKAGVASGVFLAELGRLVGVGKQGAKDRLDRLTALLQHDEGPDEKYMRRRRREAHDGQHRTDQLSPEMLWLTTHWDEIVSVATGLDAEASRLNLDQEDRDWLDELMREVEEYNLSRQIITMLGIATADLRVADPVVALPTRQPHRIHRLLAQADTLRSAFAKIG
ncbi:hypothetical protein [Kribbella sp. NPDC048928]|uniref:hypothetical protein n=1 Tax=Kribbella sp. NPDC048928 TaxID=3364111 RepID=UPI0037188F4A